MDDLIEMVEQTAFSQERPGRRSPILEAVRELEPPAQTRCVEELLPGSDGQRPMEVGKYHSSVLLPGDIEPWCIEIFLFMLDALLLKEIRERRGWTYSVKTERANYKSFHRVVIEFAFKPEGLERIEEIVNRSIASLAERNDLFEKMRRRHLQTLRMVDFSGKQVRDRAVIQLEEYHRIVSIRETLETIQGLSMSDIRRVVELLHPDRRWTYLLCS